MDRRVVELLAVGAGPANIALAVALEELAPVDLSAQTLIIEQHDDVSWQRGMLLPWTLSQVSFLKDLVTLRNPRSKYSFINYLHSTGRLDDFINLASFLPYRTEISEYLRWVARNLRHAQVEYGCRATAIEPKHTASGRVSQWRVHLADGREIVCRNLVIGIGRDPHVPELFADVPKEKLIHSTEFASRIDELDPALPYRIVVVGGAQSAAEMLWAAHQQFPRAKCTMVMRSIGLNCYQSSKFTNELFYPSFVDEFHAALPDARAQLLVEMHRTNYSGLAPDMLENLYRQIYLERLSGNQRLEMITMAEVEAATMADGEPELTLIDRKSGRRSKLRCDIVMLGTGFARQMPRLVRALAAAAGVDEISVTRAYRMNLPTSFTATCHLQGVNEATHGIADSLLSVLAARSAEIVSDLLEHRRTVRPLATVSMPR